MFGLIENLTKATVSVVLTPVAIVADIVTLPASAERGDDHPFGMTEELLTNAGKCVKQAINPDNG